MPDRDMPNRIDFLTAAAVPSRPVQGNGRRAHERTAYRIWRSLALGLLLVLIHTQDVFAADDKAPATLVIASEGARPPYNFLEGEDLAGFEIELGRELCRRMQTPCTFVAENWDFLVPGLLDHRFDAVMAAIEINAQARKKIAFSDPYVRMPAAFLVTRETEITNIGPAQLPGLRIGVEAESRYEAYARDAYPHSKIIAYANLEDAILDLAETRLDLVLSAKDALTEFLDTRRDGQCCRILADVPYDPAYFGAGIGIALRPEDEALRVRFNLALAAIRADATFDRLRAKFFSFDILPNVAPPSNLAGTSKSNGGQISTMR